MLGELQAWAAESHRPMSGTEEASSRGRHGGTGEWSCPRGVLGMADALATSPRTKPGSPDPMAIQLSVLGLPSRAGGLSIMAQDPPGVHTQSRARLSTGGLPGFWDMRQRLGGSPMERRAVTHGAGSPRPAVLRRSGIPAAYEKMEAKVGAQLGYALGRVFRRPLIFPPNGLYGGSRG